VEIERLPHHRRQHSVRRGRKLVLIVVALIVVLVVAAGIFQWLRPVPKLALQPTVPVNSVVPGPPPAPPWPADGHAALDVPGVGLLSSPGSDQPLPTASLAKVMAAYVVLRDHPLPTGTPGPGVAMTADDVNAYRAGRAQGESVVRVTTGEMLAERQLLEGMLVASGNNLAGALARWNKGTPAAFVDEMNATGARLGLAHTHYADPAGVNPATTSTVGDQLKLAEAAMADPTFAEIVAEPQVQLPLAGTIKNFNSLVGTDGIVGIKTGNSLAAGGCLVLAAKRQVAGRDELVYAAVLGAKGNVPLQSALTAGKALIDAAPTLGRPVPVLTANQPLATVRAPWGTTVRATVANAAQLAAWGGQPLIYAFQGRPLGRSVRKGDEVGTVTVTAGTQHVQLPVVATASIPSPSLRWRLKRMP
jgi:serine-type D-Ala-D-Ala carboxypeptidase (penicillin-binding protein 5/6)